jgi:hypothetical protein
MSGIEIDFRRRETEPGWQRIMDRFALAAAPKWFEWLEWILVLAAFQYLADKDGGGLARLVPAVSVLLLWFYFNAFFFRLEFRGLPLVRSGRVERIVSIILSGVLAPAFWLAAKTIADIVATHTK